jgi:hypothetical protein
VRDSPRSTRASTRPPSLRNSRTVTSAMSQRITGETAEQRTPNDTTAYGDKSSRELCRNCVRRARKPRRTGTSTASHRGARNSRNPLIRLCVGVRGCYSVSVAGSTFQACSFNHSDISPSLESTTCERSSRDYDTRRSDSRQDLLIPLVRNEFEGIRWQSVLKTVSDL